MRDDLESGLKEAGRLLSHGAGRPVSGRSGQRAAGPSFHLSSALPTHGRSPSSLSSSAHMWLVGNQIAEAGNVNKKYLATAAYSAACYWSRITFGNSEDQLRGPNEDIRNILKFGVSLIKYQSILIIR